MFFIIYKEFLKLSVFNTKSFSFSLHVHWCIKDPDCQVYLDFINPIRMETNTIKYDVEPEAGFVYQ